MDTQRKRHSPEFKTRVVLDALSGRHTLAELASAHGIHPVQITKWKQKFLKEAPLVFANGRSRDEEDKDRLIEDLYRKVGKAEMEVEWLKKKVGFNSS